MVNAITDKLRGIGIEKTPDAEDVLTLHLDRVPVGLCLNIQVEEPMTFDGTSNFSNWSCDKEYHAVRTVMGYALKETGMWSDGETRLLSAQALRHMFTHSDVYVTGITNAENGESLLDDDFDMLIRCD